LTNDNHHQTTKPLPDPPRRRAGDRGADYRDPAVWASANPAYGDYLNPEDFESAVKSISEMELRTKRLNQWVTTNTAWLPQGAWDRLAVERTLEKEIGGKIDCLPILEPECEPKKPVIGSKMDACFIVYLTAVLAINAAIEQSWWQAGCWAFVTALSLHTAFARFRRDKGK